MFLGGNEDILAEVCYDVDEVVIEDEDGESVNDCDGPEALSISACEAMAICKQMDSVCSKFPNAAHDGMSTLELQ